MQNIYQSVLWNGESVCRCEWIDTILIHSARCKRACAHVCVHRCQSVGVVTNVVMYTIRISTVLSIDLDILCVRGGMHVSMCACVGV